MSRQLPPPEDFVSGHVAKANPESLGYRELLRFTLEAIKQFEEDQEMELRAVLMVRFRQSQQQVNAALLKRLTAEEGGVRGASYGPVNMKTCESMDWLIDGFIPAKDQTLLFGEAGAGKTSAAIEIAFAVINGTPLLDRASEPKPGKVLFISSDSGKTPLMELLDRAGYSNHPGLSDGRFTVWAHSRSDQRLAWDASIPGCLALLEAIKENEVDLVVIDSCKAVTSKADLDYTSNPQITALLTFFQEVVCQHCAVLWLNHDGKESGSHAGAKAWKEIPSCIHSIERVYPKDGKGRKTDQPLPGIREWKVRKCRMGTERSFTYELDPETGRLRLTEGSEDLIVGNCAETLLQVLGESNEPSLSRQDVINRCFKKGYSAKTVDNTLCDLVRRKLIVRPQRGHFALTPAQQQSFQRRGSEREEIERDLSEGKGSPDFPTSSQPCSAGKSSFPPSPSREIAGKSPESSRTNRSAPFSSQSPNRHIPQRQSEGTERLGIGARVEAEVAPGQWESGWEIEGHNTDGAVRLRAIGGTRSGRTRCLMPYQLRPTQSATN